MSRNGVRTFFEVYERDAPTILLLTPWALASARAWRCQIPYLARHFRLLTLDPRGNGRSDRPADPGAYASVELALDAIAIMAETETRRAAIVTFGPGVHQALILAAEHAELVAGAVMITPDPWPAERYARSFAGGKLERYEGWDRFNPEYWRRDWPGFARWWASVVCAQPHSTRLVEEVVRHILQSGPDAFTANALALGACDRQTSLALARRVRCPTLVIYDDEDQIVEDDTWTPLADATGGALLRIRGANHGGWGRHPVRFNLALREFVESLA